MSFLRSFFVLEKMSWQGENAFGGYGIRFQQQTRLNRSRPSHFRQAINEAKLADLGFEDGHEDLKGKVHPSFAANKANALPAGHEELLDDVYSVDTNKALPDTLPSDPMKVLFFIFILPQIEAAAAAAPLLS
jgi:hypothetical protein